MPRFDFREEARDPEEEENFEVVDGDGDKVSADCPIKSNTDPVHFLCGFEAGAVEIRAVVRLLEAVGFTVEWPKGVDHAND